MTREEAIGRLLGLTYVNPSKGNTEALYMAIEALSAEAEQVTSKLKNPCDSLLTDDAEDCKEQKSKLDLISRQAAIETIAKIEVKNHDQQNIREGAVFMLEQLPPVTPTERTGEWIPVGEGLPKVKQEVYVTVYFTEGDYGRAYGYIDGFGNWHLYSTVEGTLNSGYDVTAWMPLPEPYREDGEA